MVGLDKLTLSRKLYIQIYPMSFSLIIFANQQNITHICKFIITDITFPHSVGHVVINLYVNRIELEHVFMSHWYCKLTDFLAGDIPKKTSLW
jgi:hypothetical protein